MKKIDVQETLSAIQSGRLPPQNESRQSELPPGHPIWELWSRMSEMFGHTWLRDQGDEPNDTWIRGLSGLTAKQFGAGLVACRDSGKAFPPSLPEFRAMCLGAADGFTAADKQAHRIFEPDRLLVDKTTQEKNRAVALDAVSGLRSMFGGRHA